MSVPNVDQSLDPGGLIAESYNIDGITLAEARSIFLDWAIKLPEDQNPQTSIRRLIALYEGLGPKDHPMSLILEEGLGEIQRPNGRNGGRKGRRI